MNAETALRTGFFLGVFLPCAAWEVLARKRDFTVPRPWRWAQNLGILLLDVLALRLLLPILAIDVARIAEALRWGLLNQAAWPLGLKALLAFAFLDLVIYAQHRIFHAVPILWRLHKVHHTDLDLDLTTGVRFHPVEILLSMVLKIGAVALLGAHWIAVLAFEIVLNATSLFNHSNARLPAGLEAFLRLFLVTPDMHRVHHSVIAGETNSNYGFNLPWWDRLLGTYVAEPAAGHQGMSLGLGEYRKWEAQNLYWLLALPFRSGRP